MASISKKRKRYKLECCECGSRFDDDYKKRHENSMHGGKRVRVKMIDAPLNPFEAAKNSHLKLHNKNDKNSDVDEVGISNQSAVSREEALSQINVLSEIPQNLETPSHIASVVNPEDDTSRPMDVCCSFAQENKLTAVSAISQDEEILKEIDVFSPTTCEEKVFLPTNSKDVHQEVKNFSQTAETESTKGISWISCAGHLSAMMNDFERCKNTLDSFKSEEMANPISFLMETIEIITNIRDKSTVFLDESDKVLKSILNEQQIPSPMKENEKNHEIVDHDPGKRKIITSSNQRHFLIALGPHQPKFINFPINKDIPKSKQNRFTANWYKEYPHLEYSMEKDAAFCFVCILFSNGPNRAKAEEAWMHDGVRQWHKMKSVGIKKEGKLAQHFSSASHKAALEDFCNFISNSKHVDALLCKTVRLQKLRNEQEQAFNKQIVNMLMDITRTLGRQGLAFRGDMDEKDSNFFQIVLLLSRHCYMMKRWLDEKINRPYHVTYLSSSSQIEFIDMLASQITKEIVEEAKNSSFFSIMADTTPDNSHKDQLSLVIRYVNEAGLPMERLLKTVEVKNKTGSGIAKSIMKILNETGLNSNNIVFQSYDFASSMSGEHQGAQKIVSEIIGRKIPYIPCQAHRLNTFLEHGCAASTIVGLFFDNLESLYVFFSSSTKRYNHLNDEMKKLNDRLMLKNLSKTRWTARAESVQAVSQSYESIEQVLSEIADSEDYDSKTKTQALGLHKKIKSFDFIVAMFFLKNILYKIKNVTETLESKSLNVIDASILLESTIISLEAINGDLESISKLISSAVIFSSQFQIDAEKEFLRSHRRRISPKRLDEHFNTEASFSFDAFYRKEFKCVLDTIVNMAKENLKNFNEKIKPLYEILNIPLKRENFATTNVDEVIKLFPDEKEFDTLAVLAELEILSDNCSGSENLAKVSEKSEELKNALPLANKICRLALTAPITVASNERTFSKLKLVKTYLRSTMKDSRLNSLLLLHAEKDLVDKINFTELAKIWTSLKQRRIKLD